MQCYRKTRSTVEEGRNWSHGKCGSRSKEQLIARSISSNGTGGRLISSSMEAATASASVAMTGSSVEAIEITASSVDIVGADDLISPTVSESVEDVADDDDRSNSNAHLAVLFVREEGRLFFPIAVRACQRACEARELLHLKLLPQLATSHSNGFSPVCMRRCAFMLYFFEKVL